MYSRGASECPLSRVHGLLRGRLSRRRGNGVLLDAPVKGPPIEAEQRCGAGLVSVDALQRPEDVTALELVERKNLLFASFGGSGRRQRGLALERPDPLRK